MTFVKINKTDVRLTNQKRKDPGVRKKEVTSLQELPNMKVVIKQYYK